MNLQQLLDQWKNDPRFMEAISEWKVIPARAPVYADFPDSLDRLLVETLKKKGIHSLYSHQAEAVSAILSGSDAVIVTPTASGKTLCYNLPVLNSILQDESSRALYLFPTKALSQDQLAELHELVTLLDRDIKTFTYDGDTSTSARKVIRTAGHIVITNPDMLHSGILPHHTSWNKLFENLKYVVIDEVHTYRGIFGSHLANVIRRLKRICQFYGSDPQFICCSATIANPAELAQRLVEKQLVLINQNGAPAGEKHVIFYNPPVVNKELGIRKSSITEASRIAAELIRNQIQTIVFARSRVHTEILVTYLKEAVAKKIGGDDKVRGYRGGYLPLQRREIERGLREGSVLGVVSTNALELGIDIGALEACVMVGYPGTIASTWQQVGRAGRKNTVSAAIMISTSNPLDQFLMNHPEYFFEKTPEMGLINPDNLIILVNHIKCASFELPFSEDENYGNGSIKEILQFLVEEKVLRFTNNRYYWMSDVFPAENISLRTASSENVVILDRTDNYRVIGEIDAFTAPQLVHKDAIYLHESQQYQITELDWNGKRAIAKPVKVDYYTDGQDEVNIQVLDDITYKKVSHGEKHWGEVMVRRLTTMYKKIKFHTHENVGWGKVHLPEQQMETTAYWFQFSSEMVTSFSPEAIQEALTGLANLMGNIAPVYLMCDPRDLRTVPQVRSPFSGVPTLYIYDAYPGGIGLAEKLFDIHELLIDSASSVLKACPCESGCPSCVGPLIEIGEKGKETCLQLLNTMK
jgi:DEAD/DEAH box helicase domain-containing protein